MTAPFRISVLFSFFLLAPAGMVTGQIADLEQHYPFNTEDDFLLDISDNGRDAELDDLGGVAWMMDEERGGVMEFPGSTNGFLSAELPEDGLPGDNFTITFWAYRDLDLCCGDGGANDGMFQVQFDPAFPSTGGKVIGGWVQKSDATVWGRVIQEDGTNINQEKGIYFMDDEEWTHFAYRGDGDDFEVIINGEAGEGPVVAYDGTLDFHDAIFMGRQGTETWGGRLDDFQIYSRALSDAEILLTMNNTVETLPGDFNLNTVLDAEDMDLLSDAVRAGTNSPDFDLDNDNLVNEEDRRVWIEDLNNSYYGDSDLNGVFDSSDFVKVFTAGEYEDATPENSGWETGDWNGDRDFTSSDFVTAFQGAGFEAGPRLAVATVPEPSSLSLLLFGGLLLIRRRQS
ncbi:MAG: PEP-CTERM sorting domain-containing protein [Pirellulaceae bacterium]|nr:PEP-CTERM sorting domain-containing protein [Pirellulaceae bacterium]